MYKKLLFAMPWSFVYDDAADAEAAAAAAEAAQAAQAAQAAADAEAAEAAATAAAGGDDDKKFSQKEVNKIMAENKRNLQTKNQELIGQLEQSKKAGNLSAEERKSLSVRIETLENEMLTKDELSKKEQDKLVRTHQKSLEDLTGDRDSWKNRFTRSTIKRTITDASVTQNAFHPSQIVAILANDTRLTEELDTEGQPTGELIPMVKFRATDSGGKPVTLDLTIKEAVEQMKDMDEYFNLFKGEGTAGLGGSNKGGGKKTDIRALAKDQKAYRAAKKAGKI